MRGSSDEEALATGTAKQTRTQAIQEVLEQTVRRAAIANLGDCVEHRSVLFSSGAILGCVAAHWGRVSIAAPHALPGSAAWPGYHLLLLGGVRIGSPRDLGTSSHALGR